MEIKPALAEQARQLAQVEASQPFAAGWGENGFEGEIGLPCSVLLAAQEGSSVLGFICLRYAADTAEIVNLAVRADCLRRGIGRQLLQQVVLRAQQLGVREITLEVNEHNSAAICLYEQAGFKTLNRRKDFYVGADALLMGKTV